MTFAFVTLFMGDAHYINGVLNMAYSLRKTETKHKIVCMLTYDLSIYQDILKKIFDEVILISYILNEDNNPLRTIKQNDIYKNWKNVSYTKWQCLSLSQYKKICLLDADLIIQKNIDHLFDLEAPAGCWGNNWDSKIPYYDRFKHGDIVNYNQINKGLDDGYLVNGHCVLLDIEYDTYKKFKVFMENKYYFKSTRCLAMYDEVAIVKFTISIEKQWTQIGKLYNTVPWKTSSKNSFILHYFNIPKPWQMKRGKWEDLKIWYHYWDALVREYDIPTSKYAII